VLFEVFEKLTIRLAMTDTVFQRLITEVMEDTLWYEIVIQVPTASSALMLEKHAKTRLKKRT
jgi:hypothetical protein